MTQKHTARSLTLTRAERRQALDVLASESVVLRARTALTNTPQRAEDATPDTVAERIDALNDDGELHLGERELDELRQAVFARYRATDTRPVAMLSLAEKLWEGIQFGSEPLSEVYG